MKKWYTVDYLCCYLDNHFREDLKVMQHLWHEACSLSILRLENKGQRFSFESAVGTYGMIGIKTV